MLGKKGMSSKVILLLLVTVSCFGIHESLGINRQDTYPLYLTLQTRDKDSGAISVKTKGFNPDNMAIVVVDMWDQHWCESNSERTASLIPDMNKTLAAARRLGIQVIFAPSDVADYYAGLQQRQEMRRFNQTVLRAVNDIATPEMPWGKTGGCECGPDRPCEERSAWTRQHEDLLIEETDLISDRGEEIAGYCFENNINTLLYMGVASNMCVTWTRSFSVLPMARYGFECLVVSDLVNAITGNGYDPDKDEVDSAMTPEFGSRVTLEHIEKYISPTVSANQLLIATGKDATVGFEKPGIQRTFSNDYVANYVPKGASNAFRQLCYDYNWVGRSLSDIPLKFIDADPVAYAELSKKANLDAALVLAVPHPGYTTHVSDYGTLFPGLQSDWFGEVVDELHKRDIKAIGYVTLGTNWKYMRDHIGMNYIHAPMAEDGQIGHTGLCFNAPGYLDLVANYTTEILTNYPIDAIRYDMLFTPKGCECSGCKAYYQEVYGEPFTTWATIRDGAYAGRYDGFNIETMSRAASRMAAVSRLVKPGIEVWQNHINPYEYADMDVGRLFDVAYIEFGSPFRLLALRGALDKEAIIVGQTLKSPIRRLIMALGARCYQYIKVDQQTALPTGDELKWVEEDLSGFYDMVSDIQPYLEDATLPSDVGIIFSEKTRYRFPEYSRLEYMEACELITNSYLEDSAPMHFINVIDLERKDLSNYRVLFVPRTSGLNDDQLAVLKGYARNGGNLVIMGDALWHNAEGVKLDQFAFQEELGLKLEDNLIMKDTLISLSKQVFEAADGFEYLLPYIPDTAHVKDLVKTMAVTGETLIWVQKDGERFPLVHANDYGDGKLLYFGTTNLTNLVKEGVRTHFGELPIRERYGKQVILTSQENNKRHILHLIEGGNYELKIDAKFVQFSKVASKYPASEDWGADFIQEDDGGITIQVRGNAEDRLLILE